MECERKNIRLTDNQVRAIEELKGRKFLAAGAGSGKTGTVTYRYVNAIADGYAKVDEILAITFTRKAAAEMMERIRCCLHLRDLGAGEPTAEQEERMARAYREIERARISTVDSFCSHVLRAHALPASLDPDFSVIDESRARQLSDEAFEAALAALLEDRGMAALDMVSAYDRRLAGTLSRNIAAAHAALRVRGDRIELPVPGEVDLEAPAGELATSLQELKEAIDANYRDGAGAFKNTTSENAYADADSILEALDITDIIERLGAIAGTRPGGNIPKVKAELEAVQGLREEYLSALRSQLAMETLELLAELLRLYDREYSRRKLEQGVLDYADIELLTRDLLRDEPSIGDHVASRFKLVMVDEFQDINPLQNEIIQLIERDNLLMVGDENQSIFGFRDAEVELFQEESKKAKEEGYFIPLADNFRSHAEIIEFVDFIFNREGMLQPGYLELVPRAEVAELDLDHRVRVMFVDDKCGGSGESIKADQGRVAEAQLIAERLREMHDQQLFDYSEMAILLRSGTNVDVFRQALDGAGVQNYLATGKGYFERLELGDVINLLRLVINPLDEMALLAILRSPMVGVSDDTLFLVSRAARESVEDRRLAFWEVIGDSDGIEGLDANEGEKLTAFADELSTLRSLSGRVSLREIARRVAGFGGYSAALIAGEQGRQALANLNKFRELAADFQEAWGNDLAAFTDFLEHQQGAGAKEADAPVEEEGVQAVTIMTMHKAKGLEFPVVAIPQMGAKAGGGGEKPFLTLDRKPGSKRVGLNYKSMTQPDAVNGGAFDYDSLEADEKRREEQEEKRLLYVAMTRAKEYLILCGSGDASAQKKPAQTTRPFDWVRRCYSLSRAEREDLDGLELIADTDGATIRLEMVAAPLSVIERFEEAEGAIETEAPEAPRSDLLKLPPPSEYVPATISASSLNQLKACPRRYYLESVLKAGDLVDAGANRGGPADKGLAATDRGTLAHALLERAPFPVDAEDPLKGLDMEAVVTELLGPGASLSESDRQDLVRLVGNLAAVPIAGDLAAADRAGEFLREAGFSMLIGRTIVSGQMDAMATLDDRCLIVDYKTDRLNGERSPEDLSRHYSGQMDTYALAASGLSGGKSVDVALVFLDRPGSVVNRSYDARMLDAARAGLEEILKEMRDGRFPPLSAIDRDFCPGCAGFAGDSPLCATASLK